MPVCQYLHLQNLVSLCLPLLHVIQSRLLIFHLMTVLLNMLKHRAHLQTLFHTKLSAKDTVKTAALSSAAGFIGTKDIGEKGRLGRLDQNLARDLWGENVRNSTMPQPYWVPIPVWDNDEGCQITVMLPFLLTHEMMAWMFESGRLMMSQLAKFPKGSGKDAEHRHYL